MFCVCVCVCVCVFVLFLCLCLCVFVSVCLCSRQFVTKSPMYTFETSPVNIEKEAYVHHKRSLSQDIRKKGVYPHMYECMYVQIESYLRDIDDWSIMSLSIYVCMYESMNIFACVLIFTSHERLEYQVSCSHKQPHISQVSFSHKEPYMHWRGALSRGIPKTWVYVCMYV